MEQILFSLPLEELEPVFKGWVKDVLQESQHFKQPTSGEHSDQLITIDKAAQMLNLKKPTLYSKVSRGEIPGVCKPGNRLYFSKEGLVEYVKSGQRKSKPETAIGAETYLKPLKGKVGS